MIDEAQLIEATRQVAATEPDRIYISNESGPACTYLPNQANGCGCIIGEALLLLGVSREILAEMDLIGATGDGGGSFWGSDGIEEILADVVTPAARQSQWLATVQREQDRRFSWGEAVAMADDPVTDPGSA